MSVTTPPTSTMQDAGATPVSDSPRPRLPGWAMLVVRIAATAVMMALVLRKIEWPQLLALLEHCDWRWWFAGFGIGLASQVIAGIRWAFLARPIGFALSLGTFVWRFFEGQFFNLLLPTSIGGDVVKAYRLSHSTQGRLLAGCTVLADRLAGLCALGVLAVTALAAQKYALGTAATLAVGAVLLGAAICSFWMGVGSLDHVLRRIPEHHAAKKFLSRLLPYQMRPSLMARALGWSVLVQFGGAVAVGLVARGLGVALPLAVWCAVVPFVALVMVLPVSISGVGVREGGLAVLLLPHGVSTDQAVAIGLLWFLCTIVSGLIGGLLFLLDRSPGDALGAAADELPARA
jgi:uncharacterized membrane protein YbhN (UPF0104 family)